MSRRRLQNRVDWKLLGRRVRELRGFEMTQSELAELLGVSQGHLSAIERGEKEAGVEVLLRIARQFDKSLDWLVTGSDTTAPSPRAAENPKS